MNVRQVIPPDAIPSVDDPKFGNDYAGDSDDEVVVVEGTTSTRAYPLRYLNYHEIVNDVVDGRPVAVTWCPLCGSAVVYSRVVENPPRGVAGEDPGDEGLVLEFGVSGKLADDDLVMYDRETESEWKQSLGEAIAGPLEGSALQTLPGAVMPYRRFDATYPDGEVLEAPGGKSEAAGEFDDPEPIDYDDDPYRDYFEGEGFGLAARRDEAGRSWDRSDLDPKAVVLGVEHDDEVLGFPYGRVEEAGGVARAIVGGQDVAVFVTPDGIHAFDADGLSFEPADEPGRFGADATTWDGATGEAADGRELDRLPARRLFAFAWQDDHGPDAFWSP